MAVGLSIQGSPSGNPVEADADGNLKVNLPAVRADAGYAVLLTERDPGTLTGTASRRALRATSNARLIAGVDTLLGEDVFNSTAQNTGVYRYAFVTMTSTMSGGSLLMNSGSTLTAGTGCNLVTWQTFNLLATAEMLVSIVASFTQTPLANQVVEFGLIPFGAGNADPTEGVFFRYTSAGLIGVQTFNGAETTTGVLLAPGSFTNSKAYEFEIAISTRGIEFYRDDVLLETILAIPNANGMPCMQQALPIGFQFRNEGTVTGTVMQFKVASWSVAQRSIDLDRPVGHQSALRGLSAYQGQSGGTMGSTALLTNSLAPGAGQAMTNTAASAGVGLGGQFSVLPTLTANTDGILCSFQNPAGGINQTSRQLVITGVKIQTVVTTVLVGGPVIYVYSLAFGHTAVSLATAETGSFVTATAKAPRRIALGVETFAAAAAVGVLGSAAGISMQFQSPIVVQPGEFIAVCAKNVGTVTSSGVITALVTFDGYYV